MKPIEKKIDAILIALRLLLTEPKEEELKVSRAAAIQLIDEALKPNESTEEPCCEMPEEEDALQETGEK